MLLHCTDALLHLRSLPRLGPLAISEVGRYNATAAGGGGAEAIESRESHDPPESKKPPLVFVVVCYLRGDGPLAALKLLLSLATATTNENEATRWVDKLNILLLLLLLPPTIEKQRMENERQSTAIDSKHDTTPSSIPFQSVNEILFFGIFTLQCVQCWCWCWC